MDKQGTIEEMLEMVYAIKLYGIRGAGLDALHELKTLCEKLIAIHTAQKHAPGYNMNGDKVSLNLVSDGEEDPT